MSCSKLSTQDVICFYSSVPPKVVLPAPVLTALPGFKLRCKATGSPLISIALFRNNTVPPHQTNISPGGLVLGNCPQIKKNTKTKKNGKLPTKNKASLIDF